MSQPGITLDLAETFQDWLISIPICSLKSSGHLVRFGMRYRIFGPSEPLYTLLPKLNLTCMKASGHLDTNIMTLVLRLILMFGLKCKVLPKMEKHGETLDNVL